MSAFDSTNLMITNYRVAIYIPCLTGGGAEISMHRLAAGLAKEGFNVDFLVSNSIGPDAEEVASNLTQMPEGVNFIDFKARTPRASVGPLVRYLKKQRPAAIISFGHNANVVALLARRLASVQSRNILSIQNNFSAEVKNATTKHEKLMVNAARLSYGSADVVTAVSRGVADDMARVLRRKKSWVKVIYNPIVSQEITEKAHQSVEHEFFRQDTPPVIMSIGRLEPQKDYRTLIQAFAKVRKRRPCRLVIFGQGYLRTELEELSRQLGIESDISMPGYTSNPYAFLSKASLFVLSSIHEGLPTVLIEAMACGCPVVSTDCPSGPMEILDGGKWGGLVPMQNVDELAESIDQSLAMPNTAAPPESWKPYTVEASVSAYIKVIRGH